MAQMCTLGLKSSNRTLGTGRRPVLTDSSDEAVSGGVITAAAISADGNALNGGGGDGGGVGVGEGVHCDEWLGESEWLKVDW